MKYVIEHVTFYHLSKEKVSIWKQASTFENSLNKAATTRWVPFWTMLQLFKLLTLWPICGWELDLLMNSSHPPSLLLVLIDWNYFFFTIECGSMWHTLLHILSHVYMKWHVWDAIRALTKFNWCTSLSLHVGLYSSVTLLRNCSLKQLELIVVTHFSNEDSHISWLFMIVWLSQEIAKIPPLLNEIVHFKPKRLYIYNVAHSKYSKYFHDRFLRLMNRVVQKTFN